MWFMQMCDIHLVCAMNLLIVNIYISICKISIVLILCYLQYKDIA